MADDFDAVFARLRAVMLAAAEGLEVTSDAPGDVGVRTATIDPKTKERGWFGTVTVKKSYVAYHLIPLYAAPELAADLPPALAKRRQGKTCFNFKAVDPAAFDALAVLTDRVRASIR